ncbi:hypothetical protein AB0891_25695 [Streptomyces sp. NPDC007259]|uniref:hypothetical protein n=1 Tax=Streptomyces sp. NPDC007259 TaxID=3154319 RepID=UPI0034533DAD
MTANTPRGITYPLLSDPVSMTQPAIQDMAMDLDGLVQQLATRLNAAAHRPAGRMSATANQLLTPFIDNTITFATEDFDIGGMIDIPTSNSRIRITEQGLYLVGASLSLTTFNGIWGIRATIINSTTSNTGTSSLQGNNGLGDDPTGTYITVGMLTYADGVTPSDITVTVASTANGNVNVQARSLWAVKMGNIVGGY